MLEPIRRLSKVGLVVLILSSTLALCITPNDRYHKSSDGDTEAIFIFEDEAVFQFRLPTTEGTHHFRYFLCKAKPGDEPEAGGGIDVEQAGDLIVDVSGGCWVNFKTGRQLLLMGDVPQDDPKLSFDEQVKFAAANQGLYWLSDGVRVTKAHTLAELALSVPELKPLLGGIKIMKIEDLFELLKKEIVKPGRTTQNE